MTDVLLKKVDMDLLLSVYGSLLTEKQYSISALFCEEDLSIAEIAEEAGVSRQCVHETLQRVEKQLTAWENQLHVLQLNRQMTLNLGCALTALENEDYKNVKRHIQAAISLLKNEEDSNGL